MTTNSAFITVTSHGWLRGFSNLLGSELARWWKTPMWWIVDLVYTTLTVWMVRPWNWISESGAVHYYSIVPCLLQAVGVVTIMQGALVSDRKQGTAAWVLSKPATRLAFVLSRLGADSLGVLLTMVLPSGVILYVVWLTQGTIPPEPIPFLKTLGIIFLCQMWYLTLTLMLGALFDSRMAILGTGAALLARHAPPRPVRRRREGHPVRTLHAGRSTRRQGRKHTPHRTRGCAPFPGARSFRGQASGGGDDT